MNFVIDEGEELSGRPAKYDVAIADGSGPPTFNHSGPRIDHRQRAALIERDDSLHPELGVGISLQQLVNAATHLIDIRALTKGNPNLSCAFVDVVRDDVLGQKSQRVPDLDDRVTEDVIEIDCESGHLRALPAGEAIRMWQFRRSY